MSGINKAILVGNLGRDPELRFTQGGTACCRLNIATARTYMNKQTNEKVEETEWHRVVVWGKMAENCNQYLVKGRQVYIEGRLSTSSYEKDGVKRYTTEVVADTVQFLGGKQGAGAPSHEEDEKGRPVSASGSRNYIDPAHDEIPF